MSLEFVGIYPDREELCAKIGLLRFGEVPMPAAGVRTWVVAFVNESSRGVGMGVNYDRRIFNGLPAGNKVGNGLIDGGFGSGWCSAGLGRKD
jgi:hypothetical protein